MRTEGDRAAHVAESEAVGAAVVPVPLPDERVPGVAAAIATPETATTPGRPRRAGHRRGRLAWGSLAIEVFSITLSVLAALAVAEWREERAAAKTRQAALLGILGEVRANRAELIRRATYYREILPALQEAARTNPEARLGEVAVPGWRGLAPPLLPSAAYDTALAMQAFAGLPFDTARNISWIYSFQRLYLQFFEKALLSEQIPTLGLVSARLADLLFASDELALGYQQLEAGISTLLPPELTATAGPAASPPQPQPSAD
jgi:hypothetical protein